MSPERLRTAIVERSYAATASALLVVLAVVAVARSPHLASSAGLTVAVSVAAPLILATMALTPVAIAGRGGIDLSVGPLMSFINVTIVVWLVQGGATSPLLIVPFAIGMGVLVGALNGVLVAVLRLQPVIATLGSYLVLSGLAIHVQPRPGGEVPRWLERLAGDVSGIPVAALVLVGTLVLWTLFSRTTLMRNIRAVGGDERAAFASGISIRAAQVIAYMVAGVFVGLAALMLTSVIASGDAGQGTKYTLTSVAALALGGVSLAGGRGGVFGAVVGAIDVYLVTYVLGTFDFGVNAPYVTQMSYGLVLVLALVAGGITTATVARLRSRREIGAL